MPTNDTNHTTESTDTMTKATTTTETSTTATTTTIATVAVRIPHGADGDLRSDAERRLSRPPGIDGVSVETLERLQPGLSATVVTLTVTVRAQNGLAGAEVADRLAAAPGVEDVRDLRTPPDRPCAPYTDDKAG